jgi:CubicO group peptidase (beta-lactamase class C family)
MRRRQLLWLLGAAALAPRACAGATDACGPPAAQDDGWRVASEGVDRAALRQMADRLASSDANVHSVLVARGGALVFERYFQRSDEIDGRLVDKVAFDQKTLHNVKSVSKSVAALALGVALDRGLIASVDEPVLNFFPDLADLRSPEKDALLLRHVLTMSVGLSWVEAVPGNDEDNDESRMHMARDPVRYVLSLQTVAPPGREFFYNTGALTLLSAIVRKATGGPLDEFAREALFKPLGIDDFEWVRVKGDTDAGGGLRLRPRDMAKIGQLVLSGGLWNGSQIVSKAWIDASTSPKLDATGQYFYGYLWWLGRSWLNGREVRWIGALGRGGQSIRIVPDLDLVVVVTAGYYQDYGARAQLVLTGVFRDVLHAVAQS